MSMKELEEMGILLPENKWGQSDLHTSVDKIQLVASGLLALGAVICSYVGNGGLLTWIGVGMFFIFVGWFTRISLKAVEVQNDQVEDFLRGD